MADALRGQASWGLPLSMWNCLFQAAQSCQPDASLIGGYVVLSGTDQVSGSSWASLRRSVIWGDVAGFCFEFDSRLDVGDQVLVRYADRDFGMVTVLVRVEAVRLIDARRFLLARATSCDERAGLAVEQRRLLAVPARFLAEAA
jgi:hypothetical protein